MSTGHQRVIMTLKWSYLRDRDLRILKILVGVYYGRQDAPKRVEPRATAHHGNMTTNIHIIKDGVREGTCSCCPTPAPAACQDGCRGLFFCQTTSFPARGERWRCVTLSMATRCLGKRKQSDICHS